MERHLNYKPSPSPYSKGKIGDSGGAYSNIAANQFSSRSSIPYRVFIANGYHKVSLSKKLIILSTLLRNKLPPPTTTPSPRSQSASEGPYSPHRMTGRVSSAPGRPTGRRGPRPPVQGPSHRSKMDPRSIEPRASGSQV